jgi:flagellar hook assembly protein FlgD
VGETSIRFSVPKAQNVKMSVYDISGRLVKTVSDSHVDAGEHTLTWDGKDSHSKNVSPGIYFLRMSTEERTLQKKMVLLQ